MKRLSDIHNQNNQREKHSDDLQIAAIALAHNLILVTHNTREFSRIPELQLEDWEIV